MSIFFSEHTFPTEEAIRDTYISMLQDPDQTGFRTGTAEEMNGAIEPHLHLLQPYYSTDGKVYDWIAMMLTSRWFYEQPYTSTPRLLLD